MTVNRKKYEVQRIRKETKHSAHLQSQYAHDELRGGAFCQTLVCARGQERVHVCIKGYPPLLLLLQNLTQKLCALHTTPIQAFWELGFRVSHSRENRGQ